MDLERKPDITKKEFTQDIMYGIFINIIGRSKSMVFIDFGVWKTNIPRQYSSQAVCLRCFWTSFDYLSSNEDLKNSDTITVGGVVSCKMYMYQQPHKEGHRWVMRKVQSIENTLKEIPYPEP